MADEERRAGVWVCTFAISRCVSARAPSVCACVSAQETEIASDRATRIGNIRVIGALVYHEKNSAISSGGD